MAIFFSFSIPHAVHAQCQGVESGSVLQQNVTGPATTFNKLAGTLVGAGGVCKSPGQKVVQVLQVILGLIGVGLVLLSLYAGFLWMTAGGEAEKVKKAKEILKNSVIGLLILLSAELVTYFIISRLVDLITGSNTPTY